MRKDEEFSFGNDSVARAYDNYLVPVLFEPWARQLIQEYQLWTGKNVLDLAAGTGVVTKQLAQQVGIEKVVAADINGQMLALARKRSEGESANIDFIECSADALKIPNDAIDVVVCQQGFQFFSRQESRSKRNPKSLVSWWKSNYDHMVFCRKM
ncbi:MAG: class I SAM-dependent methyltransferase [Cytophagales bacterium]|nr:class I SAM-dependent methyltransferase [Cytophagales bacterium]